MRKIVFITGLLLTCVSLFSQQRDSRVRDYISPVRIIWKQDSANIINGQYLLSAGNGQSDLSNSRV